MGIDPVTLGIASAVFSGVAGVSGFVESRNAAKASSREASRQAEIAQSQAEDKARLEARSNIDLEKRQKLAILKSGVALEGSPLLLMEETKREGKTNVENILKTGQTQSQSFLSQGSMQSDRLKSSGRQQLLSGLGSGAGTFAQSQLLKKKA